MFFFLTVNYHSKDLVECLLNSIAESIISPYQVVVVNNSPDEVAIHALAGDRISILESGDNIGFGRACNLGIQHIYNIDPTALIWLINPDATLDLNADVYIKSCLEIDKSIAILGTQVRDATGGLWFAGGVFNKWTGYVNHVNVKEKFPGSNPKSIPTAWVSGCSLILNLVRFTQPPAFDPAYFLYCEDADLCIRHAHQGYEIAITNQVLVTHQVSAIIGKNKRLMFRHYTFSRLLFLRRHATLLGFSAYFLYLLAKVAILLVIDHENARGRWRGLIDFLRRPSP